MRKAWAADLACRRGRPADRLGALQQPGRANPDPMPPKTPLPDPETLALQALAFIAGDDDRLERFIGLTGIDPASLRDVARDPAGLGAVLDYLLGWEPLLLEFAEALELKPESVAVARRKLPGSIEDQ
jgi:hypothetical protein